MPAFVSRPIRTWRSLVSGMALVNRFILCGWFGAALLLVSGCAKGPEIERHLVTPPELVGGKPPAAGEATAPRGDDPERRHRLVLPHVGA